MAVTIVQPEPEPEPPKGAATYGAETKVTYDGDEGDKK